MLKKTKNVTHHGKTKRFSHHQ